MNQAKVFNRKYYVTEQEANEHLINLGYKRQDGQRCGWVNDDQSVADIRYNGKGYFITYVD